MDGGLVADGELVVAGGHGPVTLEPGDPAFHCVALLVQPGVEGGRPSSGAALVLAVADLVGFLRDGAGDAAAPQVRAVRAGSVGLVGQHPVRAGAGMARAGPRHPDPAQHGLELRAVAPLPGSDHDRQRLLPLLAGQVHLGAEPAAGAAQAVTGRLPGRPAGRPGLQIPLFRAPAACWCARATDPRVDAYIDSLSGGSRISAQGAHSSRPPAGICGDPSGQYDADQKDSHLLRNQL